MAVRRFDGVDDEIRLAVGGVNISGAITVVMLIRPLASPGSGVWSEGCLFAYHNSSGDGVGYEAYLYGFNTDHELYLGNGSDYRWSTSSALWTPNEWVLLGIGKGAGSTVPKFSSYRFDTETLTFSGTNGNVGDGALVPGGQFRIGAWQSGYYLHADVAACGVWGSSLSDGEFEDLANVDALESWDSFSPAGLWLFNQETTATTVTDLTGGGANQVALFGTTVVEEEPPIPYYAPAPSDGIVWHELTGSGWEPRNLYTYDGADWVRSVGGLV